MSEFKGTPGPWSYESNNWDSFYICAKTINNVPLIRVINAAYASKHDISLITAAPELLEALQAVMFDVMANRAAISDELISEIRAAIAKALGESK